MYRLLVEIYIFNIDFDDEMFLYDCCNYFVYINDIGINFIKDLK